MLFGMAEVIVGDLFFRLDDDWEVLICGDFRTSSFIVSNVRTESKEHRQTTSGVSWKSWIVVEKLLSKKIGRFDWT